MRRRARPSRASRQPKPRRTLPAGTPGTAASHALERLVQRADALEPHLALRERPGREVDVRVGEAGEDAPPAEVDDVGAGQRSLVRADAARDAVACDRQRALRRHARVHRANDAVLEDHVGDTTAERSRMIDHVAFNVSDLDRSRTFYEQALAPLGYGIVFEFEGRAAFGPGRPEPPSASARRSSRRRAHVALRGRRPATVDAFHAAALAAGGDGQRRTRHPRALPRDYYAAFVLDPDGNNVEVVSWDPTGRVP